ncbi:MAG: SHOCT domain-containing protein [Pseudomonadota bacterium]
MMRFKTLIPSLCVVAVLGACAPANEISTRANLDPLGFREDPNLTVVEIQADALNQMADQLVQDTYVRSAANSGLIACGRAIFTSERNSVCGFGADSRGLFGRGSPLPVELVPATALVDDIQDMHTQLDTLETALPELLAEQDAALEDLTTRRDAGALSQAEYDAQLAVIEGTRTRISTALALTSEQATQANGQLQRASSRGQTGLDWHLNAVAQLALETDLVRAQLPVAEAGDTPGVEFVASNVPTYSAAVPITHVPRSGEFR